MLPKQEIFSDANAKLGLYILLGTLATIVVAYPFKDISEKLVYSPIITGCLLVGTGFCAIF